VCAPWHVPNTLKGLKRCADCLRALEQLNHVLGPDVDAISDMGEMLPARLAGAGAGSVVNTLIPFRGFVRAASGAPEAGRKFRVLVVAGMARRGFLERHRARTEVPRLILHPLPSRTMRLSLWAGANSAHGNGNAVLPGCIEAHHAGFDQRSIGQALPFHELKV